jgi:Fe(3+) dicitrate transport protein
MIKKKANMTRRILMKRPALILGACIGLCPLASVAQNADSSTVALEEGGILLPQVSIVGSKAAAMKLPASGAYIGGAELRKYNVSDVNRALRQVPGVYVREEDGYGLFPNVSLRGVSTERMKAVTIMEDGILSAPAPYSAPSAYYSPNIGRMDGLEVLKGSSQIKYGPHTTGGAINYLSTPFTYEQLGSLRLSYGAYNEVIAHLWYGDVADLGAKGKVGFLVEGYFQTTDGFKTIDQTPDFRDTDNTGFTRVEPMVKFFWDLPTDAPNRLEFKYGFSDLDADETYLGLSNADFNTDPLRRYSASRFDNIQSRNHRATLRHIAEPMPGLQLETTGYYQSFSRNWEKLHELRAGGALAANTGISTALESVNGLAILRGEAPGVLRVRNNNRDYEQIGIQSVVSKQFETGAWAHDAEIGLRYHYDEVDRFQWNLDYTQAANGTISAVNEGVRGAAGDRIQETHAFAFHAQDELKWNKFTVKPGIRVETVDQSYEQDMRRTDGGGTPANGSGDLTALSGGISLGYEINQDWNTFFGVHRGVSLPAPRAAIRNNLDEESSLSYELGTRYNDANNAFYAEAIGFFTEFNNLIVGGNLGGGGAATTENVGDINSLGLELAAGYDYGKANSWAVNVPCRLAVTLTDAQLDGDSRNTDPESLFDGGRDGSSVPYIPEYQINAEVGLEYGKVSTYVSGTYVPQTYTTAANTREQFNSSGTPDARAGKTDNYFVMDWTVRYAFKDNATLFGGVKNILNREYIASRHPHGPRPGQPRFFNVGVEMNF